MTRALGKFERLALARHAKDLALAAQPGGHSRGLFFDAAAGERVVEFVEGYCTHYEGEWAGQPVRLEEWQKELLRILFGWKRANGTRRFRTAYIELGRKNGKSFLCSALALYLLLADGEPGAQVYSSATKEEQATIVWRGAAAMVKQSPKLKKFIKEMKSKGGRLVCEKLGGFFKPLGADSDTLDGLNVHGNIVDELHAHKDRRVWDVLTTAMGARRQPLTLAITTAGTFDKESLGWQQHEYAEKVLDGTYEDDAFFAFICAIDEDDDPFDEACWGKANPNLGLSCKLDDMREQALLAARQPSFTNEFFRLRLDRWTQQVTRWISMTAWAASDTLTPRSGREELLRGRPCQAGLDLSTKLDITALVLAFEVGDETHLVCRFWLPEERVLEESRKGRRHYEAWVREGWITTTPGNVIDYDFIRREVLELAKRFQILTVAFDPWNASQIATQLLGDGIQMVEVRQGFASMSGPSKELEARVVAKRVRHGGDPVLGWMAGNAVVKKDAAGNIKPDKEKASDKIDGVVAAVMALGRSMVQAAPERSIYETRGILSLD